MTLIEALKNCYIENLDTDERLYDGCAEGAEEAYKFFVHNIKALAVDKDWEQLNSLEIDENFLDKLRDDETDEYFGESMLQLILSAAWLTNKGIDYAERVEDDDYDDYYNYEFYFSDFVYSLEYENNIDLL